MRLFVNIDHVATVRQARRTDEPDPVRAAVLAELGGADGITIHLRQDRRHIQDRDVELLMHTARTPINFELAAAPELVDIACSLRPAKATLVPEKREEVTTEGGLSLADDVPGSPLRTALERLHDAGIETSLFVDPDEATIRASEALGVQAVELHTGEYANTCGAERSAQLERLAAAAELADALEIGRAHV